MKAIDHFVAAAAILVVPASSASAQTTPAPVSVPTAGAPAATPMTMSSTAFADGGIVPNRYSQADSAPVSPAFAWADAPAKTASFVLILHDVDVMPRGGEPDNLHWMLFNIPGTARGLPEKMPATAALADGTVQTRNGRGEIGYLPLGARGVYHHYVAELYALDVKLALGADAKRADVLAASTGHVLAKAGYVGRFHR